MYQIGDQVIYGMHGVCRVADMEARVIDRKRLTYIVLEPEGQKGARYLVPTHNASAMGKLRQILTEEELQQLLQTDAIYQDGWIPDENLRKQTYRELIGSGDRTGLLKMIRTLYRQKSSRIASGKKFHLCDENFLRDAEKLLCSEIAMIKKIGLEEARGFLKEQFK